MEWILVYVKLSVYVSDHTGLHRYPILHDQLAEWCWAAKETIQDEPAVSVSVSVAAWNRVSSSRCSISSGLPT